MKRKLFTFLVAFLATLSGAVWGQQNGSPEVPITIDIRGLTAVGGSAPTGNGFIAKKGLTNGSAPAPYSNTVEIIKGGYYKIVGTESNVQISVTATDPVFITLPAGLHIDASLDNSVKTPEHGGEGVWEDRCAMELFPNSFVTLDWEGDCELSSGGKRAGINVKPDATLVLKGTHQGTLTGTCWNNQNGVYTEGAGIGGDSTNPNFGTIIIESGDIVGRCFAQNKDFTKSYGAGIGGGYNHESQTISTKGSIIIKGGNVTAHTDYSNSEQGIATTGNGAGIGGGYKGTCDNITIIGGTVNAGNNTASKDIGNGNEYTFTATPQLIIAPKDKNPGTLTVNTKDIASIDNQLNVNGKTSTLKGEVTLPEGTQVYAPNLDKQANLKAYKITYADSKISEEGTHTVTGLEEAKEAVSDMYFSPGTEVTVPSNISCNLHYYIGWYKKATSSSIEQTTGEEGNKVCTFTLPSSPVTTLQEEAFTISPVWVDMEQPILALADYEWIETNSDCPTIATMPEEAIGLLTYELVPGTAAGNRLNDVKFSGNKMIGTPSLDPSDNGYKELPDVTVKVKLTGGTEMCTVKTPMILHNGTIVITDVKVTDKEHTYDGLSHNGWDKEHGDDDAYHLLTFTFTINGETPTTSVKPREGVHYIISGYTKDDQDKNAVGDNSLEIKDAGTYRNLKLKSLRESVKFNIGNQGEKEECETNLSVTVGQRQLGLKATEDKPISYKVSSIVPDFAKDWDDYVELTKKVGDDLVNVTSGMTATVNVKDESAATEDWKTKPGVYTVTFKAEDNATVNNLNYTVAGATATRELIVSTDDATNVDVKPGDDSPWNKDFEHVYDGTMPELGSLVITVAGATETLQEGDDFSVNYPDDVNVGDHEATITFLKSTYITTGTKKDVILNITKRNLSISFKENVKTLEGVEIADLLDCDNLVPDEYPEFEGIIETKLISDNTYEVTINGFTIKDATTNNFKVANYAITVDGESYISGDDISGTVTTDPDDEGQQPSKNFCNIYVVEESSPYIQFHPSRNVVEAVGQITVDVVIPDEIEMDDVKLVFRRGNGEWETLTIDEETQKYTIKDINTHIYLKAEVDAALLDAEPNENHVYIDLSCTEDGIKLDAEREIVENGEDVLIWAEISKENLNKAIKYEYKVTRFGEWKELKATENAGEFIIWNVTNDVFVRAYLADQTKDPETTEEAAHHVYSDLSVTCKGLYLDADRKMVTDNGTTKVYLTIEPNYNAKNAHYMFRRGIHEAWEELTPSTEANVFVITGIESDIYLKATDAISTGMEDIDGTARIYTKDGSLYIYTPQQDDITVVSMTGAVVKRTKQIGLQSYPLNQGIYVVRVGEQVFKVRVK